jgi:hypothetical protein
MKKLWIIDEDYSCEKTVTELADIIKMFYDDEINDGNRVEIFLDSAGAGYGLSLQLSRLKVPHKKIFKDFSHRVTNPKGIKIVSYRKIK